MVTGPPSQLFSLWDVSAGAGDPGGRAEGQREKQRAVQAGMGGLCWLEHWSGSEAGGPLIPASWRWRPPHRGSVWLELKGQRRGGPQGWVSSKGWGGTTPLPAQAPE